MTDHNGWAPPTPPAPPEPAPNEGMSRARKGLLIGGVGFAGLLALSVGINLVAHGQLVPPEDVDAAPADTTDSPLTTAAPTRLPAITAAPSTTDAPTTTAAPTTIAAPTTTAITTSTLPPTTTAPPLIVTNVVDGDTLDLSDGTTVRLIGIDTPDQGECGYSEAASVLSALVLSKAVTLTPGARDDVDQYGRHLRYVDLPDGTDVNLSMVNKGHAIARYDSRDGYGAHAREDAYVAADAATAAAVTCQPPTTPAPPPVQPLLPAVPAPAQPTEPWNAPGPDLDCADIGQRVRVQPPDYHALDRDGDGWGCESYG